MAAGWLDKAEVAVVEIRSHRFCCTGMTLSLNEKGEADGRQLFG